MTQSAIAHTDVADSRAAGEALAAQLAEALDGAAPDALIVFASPVYDPSTLLATLQERCHPGVMVGCSSAGEFTSGTQMEQSACAVALRSSEMRFAAGIGRGVSSDRAAVTRQIVDGFSGRDDHRFPHRAALVLTDALAGHADDLVEQLTLRTAGAYRFFGGGAGDDGKFEHTQVFCGTEAASDAAVALEMLSTKPIGIGVRHGWRPASQPMRVTEADGMRVVSFDAEPAAEVFEEHAATTGQRFDRGQPLPFFLSNVIGVDTGAGHKLRVPLGIDERGAVAVAAEVPPGATAHIMGTDARSAAEAAEAATRDAVAQLGDNKPGVALFFDCVATRLRLGGEFGAELHSLAEALGPARYAGCNTYGQIARADGQFSGFHNCTAVVCVIPE
jgi:hypothetical protein